MKLIRYQDRSGAIHYGRENADGSANRIEGDLLGSYSVTSHAAEIARLLAPVAPLQILCIGLNYRRHAQEMGVKLPEYPILFTKGLNTVQGPGGPIVIPRHLPSEEVDYECELAVVIGKPCKNVSRKDALSYVLGY